MWGLMGLWPDPLQLLFCHLLLCQDLHICTSYWEQRGWVYASIYFHLGRSLKNSERSVVWVILDLFKIWNGGVVPEKQGNSFASAFLEKIYWGLPSDLPKEVWQWGRERSQPCRVFRASKTQELMRPGQWWPSNLVSRGHAAGISGTPGGRKCYSFFGFVGIFLFVCFGLVWVGVFFPPKKSFLIHAFINCMLFSLKIPYKTDGMFHTTGFIMYTLMLPEL